MAKENWSSFFVLLYGRTGDIVTVNDNRRYHTNFHHLTKHSNSTLNKLDTSVFAGKGS